MISPDAIILALALHFVTLSGPNGQPIDIAVDAIVSLRVPRSDDFIHEDVHCLVHTTDGKFISVRETCAVVEERLNEIYRRREEERGQYR